MLIEAIYLIGVIALLLHMVAKHGNKPLNYKMHCVTGIVLWPMLLTLVIVGGLCFVCGGLLYITGSLCIVLLRLTETLSARTAGVELHERE